MKQICLVLGLCTLPLTTMAAHKQPTTGTREKKHMVRTFTPEEIRSIPIPDLAPRSDTPGLVWDWQGRSQVGLGWGYQPKDGPITALYWATGNDKKIAVFVYYYNDPKSAKSAEISKGSGIATSGLYKNVAGSFSGHAIGEEVRHIYIVDGPVGEERVGAIGLVARDGDVVVACSLRSRHPYHYTALDEWMLENTAIDIFKRAAVYGMTAVTTPDTPLEPLPVIKP